MASDDRKDLVRRFVHGDETACQELFEQYAGVVRRRVASRLPARLRRRLSVSDILQETQLVAYRRREDFKANGVRAFGNWLCGIADNKLREAIRRHYGTAKRAADCEVSRGLRPDTARFQGRQPSPSEAAMASESVRRIRQAMDALPGDYREVLRLTRVLGLTLREAAECMGRSHAAVRKLYGRAFCRLVESFASQEERQGG
jgi:RNA polymerase sigma-70 factor (ECF subfamily)